MNANNHIEELLAHQDRQIQDLNDIVTKQWNEIDRLNKIVGQLSNKINEISISSKEERNDSISVIDEAKFNKPPHY